LSSVRLDSELGQRKVLYLHTDLYHLHARIRIYDNLQKHSRRYFLTYVHFDIHTLNNASNWSLLCCFLDIYLMDFVELERFIPTYFPAMAFYVQYFIINVLLNEKIFWYLFFNQNHTLNR